MLSTWPKTNASSGDVAVILESSSPQLNKMVKTEGVYGFQGVQLR